jgi:hypothetical protein
MMSVIFEEVVGTEGVYQARGASIKEEGEVAPSLRSCERQAAAD